MVSFLITPWLVGELNFWWKEDMIWFNPHTSWKKKSWKKHVNWAILKKIFIKLKEAKKKRLVLKVVMLISLPHQNNLSQPCTEVNGLTNHHFLSDTEVPQHASEKKLVLMEKITGVFSESINLKKYNNSLSANLNNHGKFMKKWSLYLKNSIKH